MINLEERKGAVVAQIYKLERDIDDLRRELEGLQWQDFKDTQLCNHADLNEYVSLADYDSKG